MTRWKRNILKFLNVKTHLQVVSISEALELVRFVVGPPPSSVLYVFFSIRGVEYVCMGHKKTYIHGVAVKRTVARAFRYQGDVVKHGQEY